jgi:hypothetical protein
MYVTSNILTHVNKHMNNPYDNKICNNNTNLETIIYENETLQKMFIKSCVNDHTKTAKWLIELNVNIHFKK